MKLNEIERQQLKEVNKLLSVARKEKIVSYSNSLSKLNQRAKKHKNNRLSTRDFQDFRNLFENVKNLDIDTLKIKRQANRERRAAVEEIKNLFAEAAAVLENFNNYMAIQSKEAVKVYDLAKKYGIENVNAKTSNLNTVINLVNGIKTRNVKIGELRADAAQLKDLIRYQDKYIQKTLDTQKKYAYHLDISEADLSRPDMVEIIAILEGLHDSEEWYAMVKFSLAYIHSGEESAKNALDGEDLEEYEDTVNQIIEKAEAVRKESDAWQEVFNAYGYQSDAEFFEGFEDLF